MGLGCPSPRADRHWRHYWDRYRWFRGNRRRRGYHIDEYNSGVAAKAISTSAGTYVFNAILAGNYFMKASQSGFKTYNATGIEIHVQQMDHLDIKLEVGSVSENVTVTTQAVSHAN